MNNDTLFHLFTNPWELQFNKTSNQNKKYICLSGNSGVGKSRLLRFIGETIFKLDNKTIAIDEKHRHHKFLSSLFLDTHKYGFQIQLNFMMQKSLLINKCIDSGYNLVMERSHFDDRIFMTHLFREGVVNQSEFDTYKQLWEHLLKRTHIPNIMILLDFLLDFAINNVTTDEIFGRRPKEFPTAAKKQKWLTSWHELYVEFFEEMRQNKYNIHIIDFNKNSTINDIAKQIKKFLNL